MEIHPQKVLIMSADGELYWHVHKKSKKIKTRMEITSFFVISPIWKKARKRRKQTVISAGALRLSLKH
jgi:hypothetical protein